MRERERERERERASHCESVRLSKVFGSNDSSNSETFKFIFFTNSAIVVASLVRSHVVFKLLNCSSDKIIRVVLTTLSVRERER